MHRKSARRSETTCRQTVPLMARPRATVPNSSNNKPSIRKVNAYRKGVHQRLIRHLGQATTKAYCQNYNKVAPKYIKVIAKELAGRPSPKYPRRVQVEERDEVRVRQACGNADLAQEPVGA